MDDQTFLNYCAGFGKKTGIHRLKRRDTSRLYALAGLYEHAIILYESNFIPKPNGHRIFIIVNLVLKYQKDNAK